MRRPRVLTTCVADRYHGPGERIVEFSFPNGKGGLIAFAQLEDGAGLVNVYRCDPGVILSGNLPRQAPEDPPAPEDDGRPVQVRDFATAAEADAFVAGVAFVNDSAVTASRAWEPDAAGRWVVRIFDRDGGADGEAGELDPDDPLTDFLLNKAAREGNEAEYRGYLRGSLS